MEHLQHYNELSNKLNDDSFDDSSDNSSDDSSDDSSDELSVESSNKPLDELLNRHSNGLFDESDNKLSKALISKNSTRKLLKILKLRKTPNKLNEYLDELEKEFQHDLNRLEKESKYDRTRHFDDVQLRSDVETLHKMFNKKDICNDNYMEYVIKKLIFERDNTTDLDMENYLEYDPDAHRPVFNHFIACDSHGEDLSHYYEYIVTNYYPLIGACQINM